MTTGTMEKVRILITVFFVIQAFWLSEGAFRLDAQSPDTDNPVISFDHEDLSYYFGDLDQNETAEKVITIRNTGGRTLIIEQIQPDCGCTIAEITNREIGPGQSGTVTVKLTVGRNHGMFIKKMKVISNDPKNSVVTVVLRARVTVTFDVDPHFVYFGEVKNAQLGAPRYVRLIGDDSNKTTITHIDPQSPYLDAHYIQPGPTNSERRIKVTLLSGAPLGEFKGSIDLHTDHPLKKIISITVHAFIINNTMINPKIVTFNVSGKSLNPQRSISVSNNSVPDFSISAAEIVEGQVSDEEAKKRKTSGYIFIPPANDDLTFDIRPSNANGQIQINVTFAKTLKPKERIHGIIRLHTSDPLEPTVDTEYHAFFSGP